MKQLLYLFIYLSCVSCGQRMHKDNYHLDVNRGLFVEETTLMKGRGTYIDIQMTDSFIVFIDYKSDTIVQAYKKNNFSGLHQFGLRKDKVNEGFVNPKFTQSDTLRKDENALLLTDGHLIKKIFMDADKEMEVLSVQIYPLPSGLTGSTNYNFTSADILGVPLGNNTNKLFYFYESGQYYWVEPKGILPPEFSRVSNAYLTNLCANEKENSIVSALRFSNHIQFYNFDAELKTSVTIGDSILAPKMDSPYREIDILNTVKHAIALYGTPRYVYCLYDGTADYSAHSSILVFKWNGEHVATIKTSQSITKIAVDQSDTYLVAIVRNQTEGYDIVKYTLPAKF